MFTALTMDNIKISIEDALPGESYLCPICGNSVMVKAASSDNVRTHFAHKRNALCSDSWKHDMSDWHFEWQSKFPIESREVVVENSGAIHRADVLINNTVIEFQHSPISGEEFEARNSFYKNCGYSVVWLFDAADRMKIDDCFRLVWKRKTTLFSNMKTPIDALYIQHYLPESEDNILLIKPLDPKEVRFHRTVYPIKPDNFLKEYGSIQDESVLSIHTIFEMTKRQEAYNRMARELEERRRRAEANAVFGRLLSIGHRGHRRF